MLRKFKQRENLTYATNVERLLYGTIDANLDFFATVGVLRGTTQQNILVRFSRAYYENPTLAMKNLFFARDIRGGLGERRTFRIILRWLAQNAPTALRKNLALVAEYGRWDDLLCLLSTPCEWDVIRLVAAQLKEDLAAKEDVSLLAKWLPSVNASNPETVKRGKRVARMLGYSDAEYRRILSRLRAKLRLIENSLRTKDYTFDYDALSTRALLKYRAAFWRNDRTRYQAFLEQVAADMKAINAERPTPYDTVRSCFDTTQAKQIAAGRQLMLKILEGERYAPITA